MNPQENNTPPVQETPPDWQAEPATEPVYQPQEPLVAAPVPEPKKRNKKLAVLGVIAVLVLLAIGTYVAYALFLQPKPVTADVIAPVTSVDSTKTDNAKVNAATDELVKSTETETELVITDDSSSATDANKDAAKIEESIDENSF